MSRSVQAPLLLRTWFVGHPSALFTSWLTFCKRCSFFSPLVFFISILNLCFFSVFSLCFVPVVSSLCNRHPARVPAPLPGPGRACGRAPAERSHLLPPWPPLLPLPFLTRALSVRALSAPATSPTQFRLPNSD